jgi:hypothetical protein
MNILSNLNNSMAYSFTWATEKIQTGHFVNFPAFTEPEGSPPSPQKSTT